MNDPDQVLAELEKDEPREAVQEAKQLLERESLSTENRSRLTYGLAVGYFKLGQFEKALGKLRESEDPRRWFMIGFTLMEMQRFEQAARAFENAGDARAERRNEALLLAADALGRAQQVEEARDQFERLLDRKLSPSLKAETLFERGRLEARQDRPGEALSWWERVLSEHEDSDFAPESALLMAQLHGQRGRIQKAQERIRWVLDRDVDREWKEMARQYRERLETEQLERQNRLREYEY